MTLARVAAAVMIAFSGTAAKPRLRPGKAFRLLAKYMLNGRDTPPLGQRLHGNVSILYRRVEAVK